MEILEIMSPTNLDMKNAKGTQNFRRNSIKDRITHFNISVAVKYHRENKLFGCIFCNERILGENTS